MKAIIEIEIEIQPFLVPELVYERNTTPSGITNPVTIPLRSLSSEALEKLCQDFTNSVFENAGGSMTHEKPTVNVEKRKPGEIWHRKIGDVIRLHQDDCAPEGDEFYTVLDSTDAFRTEIEIINHHTKKTHTVSCSRRCTFYPDATMIPGKSQEWVIKWDV